MLRPLQNTTNIIDHHYAISLYFYAIMLNSPKSVHRWSIVWWYFLRDSDRETLTHPNMNILNIQFYLIIPQMSSARDMTISGGIRFHVTNVWWKWHGITNKEMSRSTHLNRSLRSIPIILLRWSRTWQTFYSLECNWFTSRVTPFNVLHSWLDELLRPIILYIW